MGLVRLRLEHCATRERGFRPEELVYRVASVPIVRIRILADAESHPGLRALVDAACPAGEWRYPDYCYVEVRETIPVSPVSVPMASSLGGALSRLRAAVRRGACGLILSSQSVDAAMFIAHRLSGISWQSAVSGPGSDRMNLRLFGLLTG